MPRLMTSGAPMQALQRSPRSVLSSRAPAVASDTATRAVEEMHRMWSEPDASTVRIPFETQAFIEWVFALSDRAEVLAFLQSHPPLVQVLLDLYTYVFDYFPNSLLSLRVVDTAPTRDAPDGRRLVLFIATDFGYELAMEQMDRLMAAWQPDVQATTPGPFSVDVAFGTTNAQVEVAAQKFVQRHSGGYKAHSDLAHRFLHAANATEQALARAELAAHLAHAQGDTLSENGGDISVVLARLRRQADAQP